MWFLSLLACTLLAVAAFVYVDMPVALCVEEFWGSATSLGSGLSSIILLGGEAACVLVLVIIRIARGRLSPFQEATALACLASICTYEINGNLLKVIFGVPDTSAVLNGAHHAFHFLRGSSYGSFPSGHMVLACAFAGVYMRRYPASILPLSGLLLIGAVLLIGGNWHFVSDVIAGVFVGISAGLLVAEIRLSQSA